MMTTFQKTLLIGFMVFGLYTPGLFAAPADFDGVWETNAGWADEFFGMGGTNFFNCNINADIKTVDDIFTINSIVVKCANSEQERFYQFTPRIDFKMSANGELSNPFGKGKISDRLLKFQIEDAYDGIHYFKAEVKEGTLFFGWSYEGEEGSSFDISGGKAGMQKI